MLLVLNVPEGDECTGCAFHCVKRETNYVRGVDVPRCRIFDSVIKDNKKCEMCHKHATSIGPAPLYRG